MDLMNNTASRPLTLMPSESMLWCNTTNFLFVLPQSLSVSKNVSLSTFSPSMIAPVFDVLNAWGKDVTKRFVVLHHSILSEGINVNGLEAVLFMRNMDYIGISQTIGRVIRKGAEDKVFGLVCVPVYSNVGISTAKKVEAVVDTIFNQGKAATTVIRR